MHNPLSAASCSILCTQLPDNDMLLLCRSSAAAGCVCSLCRLWHPRERRKLHHSQNMAMPCLMLLLIESAGQGQLRDVFAAFAGFGIRSPAINSTSFRISAGGVGSSSSSKQHDEASPAVLKPLMLEMDGFR
jgi:hypothetical protein